MTIEIKKCSVCGKLLKRDNLTGICPSCDGKKENQVIEQNKKIENIIKTKVQIEEKIESKDEVKGKNEEPKISAGKIIREKFLKLIDDNKITNDILEILKDTEKTKEVLGIRYAFLKEYDDTITKKANTYINGHARYTAKTIIKINEVHYIITNDLYSRNVDKFIGWADSISSKN